MTDPRAGRLMLLDSASMYFRAFYGVPEIKAPDGTPVNAVRGFLDFISRLVGDYGPTDLVCCWDNDWRPQWRVDLLPSYKAHRVVAERTGAPDVEEVPDPLEVQVPIILDVLDAFGLCVKGVDGYEADDVIGSFAAQAAAAGGHRHRRPRPLPARRRRGGRAGPLHRPRRGQPRTGHQRLGARQVRRRRAAVRRLRDHARRRLRRAARGARGRREDRGDAAPAVRRHGRRSWPRPPTRTPTWDPARAARSRPRPTTSRSHPRSSRSPATSTSARPPPALPAEPRDLARVAELGTKWGIESPVQRLTEVAARPLGDAATVSPRTVVP